ncbi:hypothetical protein PVAP13_1NG049500 [Panicum virgatum]|uniref:NHL repeat-containing protein n=1 Tax=Panicum virgatum TaxID=38727 RepID=A0A8T0WPQ4_PANVG|nr:hypothetical protein PVAP13_1NG049500 [Panicum virgatum]KAG2648116.1 hypothetical protein PVAP13_1NG049500 [Panicum virgatum]KAG2648117.1 hypothetical protein PVAP13_1NG049500 [Panicum virgatum]
MLVSSPSQAKTCKDSRPKLVAGSPEGFPGHVDGKVREARMNHPKGFTVDDRGNIYVADAMNMAIRKISDTDLSAFLELFSASFSAYPTGSSGSISGDSIQGNKSVRGLRFSAVLS